MSGPSGFSVGRGACHVTGRSLRASGPPFTACPLRFGIHACACFHSPATWQKQPLLGS